MRARTLISVFCMTGLVFVLACGGARESTGTPRIEDCLPGQLPALELVRDGEILHFAGDSLFNYINGAAEMYHKYDFEEVHAAKYIKDGGEITVDIYTFASPDRAFGMYTTLRPDAPDTVGLGVEGFAYGPVLIYAKGPYMVSVQTYDEALFAPADIKALAAAVEKNLAGTTHLPPVFELFPRAARIPHSEKIYAESYLGHGFLTDVYAVDYSHEAGDMTLFLIEEDAGHKLSQWEEARRENMTQAPALPYDDGSGAIFSERYYGDVAAGAKGGRLAGAVGYREGHERALGEWLMTLPQAPE